MSNSTRQSISPTRQNAGLWSTLAKPHAAGSSLPPHQHTTGQLIFATNGVMLVETSAVRWTVPPQRALWVPPGCQHTIEFMSETELRTIYCEPTLIEQSEAFSRRYEVHAIAVSSLIRELILGLFSDQHIHATRQLMAKLLLQTLGAATSLPTHLPMPSHIRLRRALLDVLKHHRWQLSVSELASLVAMSERTLARHLSAELGMNFRAWRQRARIIASLDLLANDQSVKAIATTLHFASASAYVAAFREVMGTTPNTFGRTETI
jgi:AraC-like DNA-binding protein